MVNHAAVIPETQCSFCVIAVSICSWFCENRVKMKNLQESLWYYNNNISLRRIIIHNFSSYNVFGYSTRTRLRRTLIRSTFNSHDDAHNKGNQTRHREEWMRQPHETIGPLLYSIRYLPTYRKMTLLRCQRFRFV